MECAEARCPAGNGLKILVYSNDKWGADARGKKRNPIFSFYPKNGINIHTVDERDQVFCSGTESRQLLKVRYRNRETFATLETQEERALSVPVKLVGHSRYRETPVLAGE
ncbi:MAG: hypothetical protein CVU39_27250 [Chloroflexi bacterium HGW-Chloroflexi-10]|nr:MAG: hypothetical protein CVU39_27250 [Chloroflexi bacterium HGW-Chloroflexi-10]